jgi:hypothetical protein
MLKIYQVALFARSVVEVSNTQVVALMVTSLLSDGVH